MLGKKISLLSFIRVFLFGMPFMFLFTYAPAGGTEEYQPFPKETIDKQSLLKAYYGCNSSDLKLAGVTTYNQLVLRLKKIERLSKGRISVGPLVRSDGTGLLPADIALMDEIIDTVPEISGLEKNTVENFGLSTQGRPIMAARAGNRQNGRKVMIIAQQHGNEVTSTEAVLDYLFYLATSKDPTTKKILKETDVLFIVRANPDGGEPDGEKCLMANEIPFWGEPFADGAMDCAMHRWNLDPQAGFLTMQPPGYPPVGDLYGAAFLGFDLNRYHYALLDGPIYPVETQAMIYAMKTFAPEFLVDLHNQNTKIRCDYTTEAEQEACANGTAGEIIDGTIQAGSITIDPTDADVQIRSERMGAHLLATLNRTSGRFARFAQVSSSLPVESRTTVDAAMELGIVANWIEIKANEEVIGYAAIAGGESTLHAILGMPFTASLNRSIELHKIGIHEYLKAVSEGIGDIADDNSGYDTNPAWAPPNFDLFIISDQLSDILLGIGEITEPYTDDTRVVISPID